MKKILEDAKKLGKNILDLSNEANILNCSFTVIQSEDSTMVRITKENEFLVSVLLYPTHVYLKELELPEVLKKVKFDKLIIGALIVFSRENKYPGIGYNSSKIKLSPLENNQRSSTSFKYFDLHSEKIKNERVGKMNSITESIMNKDIEKIHSLLGEECDCPNCTFKLDTAKNIIREFGIPPILKEIQHELSPYEILKIVNMLISLGDYYNEKLIREKNTF
jgi:hypothetical protein